MISLEKHRWIAPLAIVVAVTIFLGPIAQSDFIEWDDYATIAENPSLNPPTFDSFVSYWTTPYMSLYFPVTQSVWHLLAMWDYSPDNVGLPTHPLHLRPGIFKLANLFFHTLTSWLAMHVLMRLGAGRLSALLGALAFALHPLQVETIGWTSGLKDILCGLFMFAAMERYLVARFANPVAIPWLQSLFFGILALLSKPLGMVLPGMLLMIEIYLLLLRITSKPAFESQLANDPAYTIDYRRAARSILARLIPFFVIAISFALWIKLKIQTGEQVSTQVDVMYRPFVALDSISFYLQKLAWPFGLAFDYGRTPISVLESGTIWRTWILPVGLWIALVFFAWKQSRLFLWLALALFIVPIVPVLGLATFEFMDYSTVADHYVYSSMLGAAVLVAFCVERSMRLMLPLAIVIVLLLGIRSLDQTRHWQDGKAVALQTLRVDPDSWPTWGNLAGWHLDRREFEEAEKAARTSLEIRPLEEKNRVSAANLAGVYVNTGRSAEAIPLLVKVVHAEQENVNYRLALAEAYKSVGRYNDSLRQFQAALHFDPKNQQAFHGIEAMSRLVQRESASQPATNPSETK